MNIGIDATNLKAGGGAKHIIELLKYAEPKKYGINKIVIWGQKNILDQILNENYIEKIDATPEINNLIKKIIWQFFTFDKKLITKKCDVLFVPGGSYLGSFRPFFTMSRNMLPFETREIFSYGFSKIALRLFILRFVQLITFKRAAGLIFLSKFAKKKISNFLNIENSSNLIIPHGVNENKIRKDIKQESIKNFNHENPFKIVYLSTIEPYKHQWNVIEAISNLIDEGFPLSLTLIGSAYKKSYRRMLKVKRVNDANENWCDYIGYWFCSHDFFHLFMGKEGRRR